MVAKRPSREDTEDRLNAVAARWRKTTEDILRDGLDHLQAILQEKGDEVEFAGAMLGIIQACSYRASLSSVGVLSVLEPIARDPDIAAPIAMQLCEEGISLFKSGASTKILKADSLQHAKQMAKEFIDKHRKEQHGTGEEAEG
jgi:hypothetical protein